MHQITLFRDKIDLTPPLLTPYSLGAYGASILAPKALDIRPPFENPGSAIIVRTLVTNATCSKTIRTFYLLTTI